MIFKSPLGKAGAMLGVLASVALLHAPKAQAQTGNTLFSDDFGGTTLDPVQWWSYDTRYFIGSTQFGGSPTFAKDPDGTTYMKVPISTYNPNKGQPGLNALGTQVVTRQKWPLGTGVEFEARIRAKLPPGLVLGFFSYGDAGKWEETYQKTEIDWEFLTKQPSDSIWTNIWDDWNPLRGGPRGDMLSRLSGANWSDGNWHTYKIRWMPGRSEWLIDGKLMRTDTSVKPGSPMGVRFNNWLPSSNWGSAYDSGMNPVSTAANNRTFAYDVDYLRVSTIAAPSRGVWGNGTGLTARYFPTKDLSGNPSVIRLDPRINFDWGDYAPADGMSNNGWSARWSGYIQPQFSEKYTFYLTSDDGSRLYLNNQLVLSNWRDQSATEKTYAVTLQAGQKYPIRVEYYENTGGAVARLSWSSTSTAKQLVPTSQLYPETTVAPPVFSPSGGTYTSTQNVAITSSTAGAVVRYTLDGSDPLETSPALASGTTLRVNLSKLVRARAFLSGQAPSEFSAANYIVSDSVKPTVAIASPAANGAGRALPTLSGTATDNAGGSGIGRVNVQIRRISDNMRWTGTGWVNREYGLNTVLTPSSTDPNSVSWAYTGVLPTGTDVPAGTYEIKAIAYDLFSNQSLITTNYIVDLTSPKVAITSPVNGATVTSMDGIAGTTSDAGGSGLSRVTVSIRRPSDGYIWNGWVWLNSATAIPTVLSGNTWSVVVPASNGAGLPTGTYLPNGTYEIRAVSYDNAGNASVASITVNKGTSTTVKSASTRSN